MRRIRFLLGIFMTLMPVSAWAQENQGTDDSHFKVDLEPIAFGFRLDDNVYRSYLSSGRFTDGIYFLSLGADLSAQYGVFRGNLGYRLGADQYQYYSSLNNLKNHFDLLLSLDPGDFNFFYKKGYFIRASQNADFNYFDDNNLLGALWSPEGPWNYEARFKYYSREYYDGSPWIKARNFTDRAAFLGVEREVDEKFSLKLEGSYNNRRFNRNAVDQFGMEGTPPLIQTDETWTVLLNAHVYFESILQDITVEGQRTLSNSYGFSNTVQSVSWAAVVRPVSSLYLQLFFRLYSKSYDAPPLTSPYLQLGFVDEDGQDLLAVKTSLDLSPQWTASLSLSRMRNESTQPGQFYIKNMISAQVRRTF
jgi:hypothetical protein